MRFGPAHLGKVNFLFIGHPEAGERSAVIYTLLGSCRRHGINPFDYLKDLFTRLPAAKITQIKEFTPAAWAKTKEKEKMFAQAAGAVETNLRFSIALPCQTHSPTQIQKFVPQVFLARSRFADGGWLGDQTSIGYGNRRD